MSSATASGLDRGILHRRRRRNHRSPPTPRTVQGIPQRQGSPVQIQQGEAGVKKKSCEEYEIEILIHLYANWTLLRCMIDHSSTQNLFSFTNQANLQLDIEMTRTQFRMIDRLIWIDTEV